MLAADDEDGNGLQLENIGPTFSSSQLHSVFKKSIKTSYGLHFFQEFTRYLALGVVGAFCVKARVIRCNLAQFLQNISKIPVSSPFKHSLIKEAHSDHTNRRW